MEEDDKLGSIVSLLIYGVTVISNSEQGVIWSVLSKKTRKKPDNYKRTTADLRALVRFSFCLFFLKNGRLCEKHCIMSGYNLFGHTDNCYQITVKPVKHIGPCVSVCIRNVALTEYRNCFLSTMAGAAFTSSRIKTTELQTQFD